MQSRSPKIIIKMGGKRPEITPPIVNSNQETQEKDQNALEVPTVPSNSDSKKTDENVVDISASENSSDDVDKDTDTGNDSQKQMVLYNPPLNGSQETEVIKAVKKVKPDKPRSVSKAPPEVGAFTVQCATCFKWRLIPDQEKYEVIREHLTDQPFLCETTRQWGREVSCEDPTDIEQDGTRIWAIDKPNIAKPPPGWKRVLRLRNEGGSKFADVYYTSPTGAKLRSLPDVVRYLESHPEHAQGIELGRFSFQIPKPLHENYVRKRSSQVPSSPAEPIAWAGPSDKLDLQLAVPLSWAGPEENRNGTPAYVKTPEFDSENQVAKKAKRYNDECL